MIIYLLIQFFITIINFLFGLVPVIETPVWLVSNLPQIFSMIFGFNQYLPIFEVFGVVAFLISFSLSTKISFLLLKKFGIEL